MQLRLHSAVPVKSYETRSMYRSRRLGPRPIGLAAPQIRINELEKESSVAFVRAK